MRFLQQTVVALKRAGAFGKSGCILADVQSDVLLLSRMHITAFSVDQQPRQ